MCKNMAKEYLPYYGIWNAGQVEREAVPNLLPSYGDEDYLQGRNVSMLSWKVEEQRGVTEIKHKKLKTKTKFAQRKYTCFGKAVYSRTIVEYTSLSTKMKKKKTQKKVPQNAVL